MRRGFILVLSRRPRTSRRRHRHPHSTTRVRLQHKEGTLGRHHTHGNSGLMRKVRPMGQRGHLQGSHLQVGSEHRMRPSRTRRTPGGLHVTRGSRHHKRRRRRTRHGRSRAHRIGRGRRRNQAGHHTNGRRRRGSQRGHRRGVSRQRGCPKGQVSGLKRMGLISRHNITHSKRRTLQGHLKGRVRGRSTTRRVRQVVKHVQLRRRQGSSVLRHRHRRQVRGTPTRARHQTLMLHLRVTRRRLVGRMTMATMCHASRHRRISFTIPNTYGTTRSGSHHSHGRNHSSRPMSPMGQRHISATRACTRRTRTHVTIGRVRILLHS